MAPTLEGKVCIVTGAASGIGLATAQRFLADGAAGVTFVDLSAERLQDALAALPEAERERAIVVAGDVSDEATVEVYIRQTVEKWGRLDVSVQCAGISQKRTSLIETDVSVLDRIWKVNVRGTFLGLQQSVKAMLASPSGGKGCSIVLISSQIGLDGCPGLSAYGATKFAVRGMMSCAAQEYGPMGIRINAVCPGPIDTPLISGVPAELMQPHVEKCSLKRLGQADELASAILFLASDAGSYCSGTTLKVDGGWSKFC